MIHKLLNETFDLILMKMDQKLHISQKSSHRDLVTNVDQEIEAFLSRRLKEMYPECQILGEETDKDIDLNDKQVWIIDPIDGTSNFVAKGQEFGILLTHYQYGKAVEAYFCDVIKRDIYHCIRHQGVTKNHAPFTRDYDLSLKTSLISMSACFFQRHVKHKDQLIKDSLGIRYAGSCAIDGIGVLEGWLGAYGIRIASPWDIAPHLLFAKELGLVCLNLDGSEREIHQDTPFIFGQKEIVETLLEYC